MRYNNVDMMMGIKNVYEIEGINSTRDSCMHFWNRLIPFLPKMDKEQRFIKIDLPFISEMSLSYYITKLVILLQLKWNLSGILNFLM